MSKSPPSSGPNPHSTVRGRQEICREHIVSENCTCKIVKFSWASASVPALWMCDISCVQQSLYPSYERWLVSCELKYLAQTRVIKIHIKSWKDNYNCVFWTSHIKSWKDNYNCVFWTAHIKSWKAKDNYNLVFVSSLFVYFLPCGDRNSRTTLKRQPPSIIC